MRCTAARIDGGRSGSAATAAETLVVVLPAPWLGVVAVTSAAAAAVGRTLAGGGSNAQLPPAAGNACLDRQGCAIACSPSLARGVQASSVSESCRFS